MHLSHKTDPLISYHLFSPVGRGSWIMFLFCCDSVLMNCIIHFDMLAATLTVTILSVHANMLTSGIFHIGQTLSATGQSASFKVQFFCLSSMELINYTALPLSVLNFHHTCPCPQRHEYFMQFFPRLMDMMFSLLKKNELYALPKLGPILRLYCYLEESFPLFKAFLFGNICFAQ